ncbi:MAG: sugar ABC transporter permease [Oscillospiraceae bacterium]|nr:sugar ABC transporter permease [Clostridia bacterium]MBR0391510.1 sugar ABC transporter permease [Oscillospiraceae bacterium]QTE72888.1 sugar ABC transporter permease [Clostridiales bacterium FE2011]QTE75835.1 sugar ABC transporter permease [Clostridiales bacterium FE2010]
MLKKNAMLIILILVFIFFTIMTNGRMFKPTSFASLINQNAYVYILGCGMLMCMLTGGNIDLSCGAFVCLLGAIGGMMMVIWGWSTGVSLVAMLLVGIIYGCGLGALIAYVRVPPWIATLAGYLAFRGLGTSILSVSITNSISFKDKPDFLNIFSGVLFKTPEGQLNVPCMIVGIVAALLVVLLIFKNRLTRLKKGYEVDTIGMDIVKSVLGAAVILLVMFKLAYAGGIPTVLLWVAAVVLFYAFITSKTTIGRHFYVVGGNIEAARLSGVNTKKIMFIAYLNMAILTAISAMTVVSRYTAANADAGKNFEMDAISACVVGGVSASGGAGSVLGMVIGATLIGVINLGMFQINLDANYQRVVKGFVLLAAVVFDILSKKKQR